MQQTKISSNIRYFWQTVGTPDKRKREEYRLSLNVPLLSLLFVLSDFPSLLLSLVFPVLHAEMISISELMRFSWTKISFSPPETPLPFIAGSCTNTHWRSHTLSVSTLHTLGRNVYNFRYVYNRNKHLFHIWKCFTCLKQNWVSHEHCVRLTPFRFNKPIMP